MRTPKNAVALSLLLLFTFACSAWAEKPIAGGNEDPWSSTTVTHIEYNPWGLATIRIPRIPPRDMKSEETGQKDGKFMVLDCLWPLIGVEKSETSRHEGLHAYILQIPFYNQLAINRLYEKYDKTPREYGNPFDETWQANQPLISGIDFTKVVHAGYRKGGDENIIYRMRILDSLIFCLFEAVNWTEEPGPEYVEWLNLPMVTTFAREKVRDKQSLKILETPFSTVLTREKQGDHQKTCFLDLLVATIYESNSAGKGESWTLLDLPLTVIASSHRDEKTHDFSFFTVGLNEKWLSVQLWRERKSEDGKITRDYGRIPLLGPMWSTMKPSDGDMRVQILPRIF